MYYLPKAPLEEPTIKHSRLYICFKVTTTILLTTLLLIPIVVMLGNDELIY